MRKKNYDQSVKINHNPNCIQVNPNSGKTNVIELNKNQAPDIDKNFLCVKDSFESNYPLLINGREKVENEKLKNPIGFIDY